ncbi:hypothetical protein IWQ60_009171 [Tieghemiomyces parasiticus]|uniref:GOST seven transmembrane domain-containing protein n=1 Tax=Tieghemiomyces parasiticus TaxID=78921 RepID=A0A9W7ZX72_9FUNG|nr:hypothetical protein IWQ60_009171 [Tieghemiomyces parasiticus]
MHLFRGCFLVGLVLARLAAGRLELHTTRDTRPVIPLMEFGFYAGGQLHFVLDGLRNHTEGAPADGRIAVMLQHARTPAGATVYMNGRTTACPLDEPVVEDLVRSNRALTFTLADVLQNGTHWTYERTIGADEEGTWVASLINCRPRTALTFRFSADNTNPGGSRLSAGDLPLPRLYQLAAVAYAALTVLWAYAWATADRTRHPVDWHHRLLLGFLALVTVHKLLQSHRLAANAVGHGPDAWLVGFYVFAFLKGLMSIVIIALLASGWLFMRPFLTPRDKRIVSCVVPLQVMANVAHTVQNETALGSVEHATWMRVLPFVDFTAFLLIIWTIIQTRQHLFRASEIDGKASVSLRKYKVWGTFYVLTLVYLYGTRVVAQYLNVSLPFHYVRWLSEAIVELTSITFYLIIGYKLRPGTSSTYSLVDDPEYSSNAHEVDDPWQVEGQTDLFIPLQTQGGVLDVKSQVSPIHPMLAHAFLAIGLALANCAAGEYLGYTLVYGKEEYLTIKQNLQRTQAKLDAEEANDSGTGNPKKRERRLEEMRKQIKVYNTRASSMALRTSLATAALQIVAFYLLNSVALPGVTVAKLPFEPYSFIQGLSHRGLAGDDPTDCSAVFIFILSSVVIKAAFQRYFDLGIRQGSMLANAFQKAKETSM